MEGMSPRLVVALSHIVIFAPISVSELAIRLNVSLATASQTVSQLTNAGFVERNEDPVDHRRTLVNLSKDKGSQTEQYLLQKLGPLEKSIHLMGAKNFSTLCLLLDNIIAGLESQDEAT